MKKSRYVPGRGDLIWLDFNPQAGHEQGGRRPALVISPKAYNQVIGLALVCPITSRIKGYPFEVNLPGNLPITGAILTDHMKSQDWRARNAELIGELDNLTLQSAMQLCRSLLQSEES